MGSGIVCAQPASNNDVATHMSQFEDVPSLYRISCLTPQRGRRQTDYKPGRGLESECN